MTTRSMLMLKAAANGMEAGSAVGRGLRKALSGVKKVVTLSGDAGQGLAEGLGFGELGQGFGRLTGQLGSMGVMAGGVGHMVQKVEDSIEDARMRREIRRQQRMARSFGGM